MSLIAAFYESQEHAKDGLNVLKCMEREHAVRIRDGAIMMCDKANGKLKVVEEVEVAPGDCARRDALVAVIFPPSVLGLGLTGAAVRAAYGHFSDQGFNSNLLQEVAENLPPGGAALVAVVEELWVNMVGSAISGYEDLRLYRLDPEAAEQLGRNTQ